MEKVELFQGIDRSSIEAIMNCFKPETRSFKKGDTIIVYCSAAGPISTVWTVRENIPFWKTTDRTTFSARFSPCPTALWATRWRPTVTVR